MLIIKKLLADTAYYIPKLNDAPFYYTLFIYIGVTLALYLGFFDEKPFLNIKYKKSTLFSVSIIFLVLSIGFPQNIPTAFQNKSFVTQKLYNKAERKLDNAERAYDQLFFFTVFAQQYTDESLNNPKRTHYIERVYYKNKRYFESLHNPTWIFFLITLFAILGSLLTFPVIDLITFTINGYFKGAEYVLNYIYIRTPAFKKRQRELEEQVKQKEQERLKIELEKENEKQDQRDKMLKLQKEKQRQKEMAIQKKAELQAEINRHTNEALKNIL